MKPKKKNSLNNYKHWYVSEGGGYWIVDACNKTAARSYCRENGYGWAGGRIREATEIEYKVFAAQRKVKRAH